MTQPTTTLRLWGSSEPLQAVARTGLQCHCAERARPAACAIVPGWEMFRAIGDRAIVALRVGAIVTWPSCEPLSRMVC